MYPRGADKTAFRFPIRGTEQSSLRDMESIPKFSFKIHLMKPEKPAWLEPLLADRFFTPCEWHMDERRNDENIFCISCAIRLCPYCATEHIDDGGEHELLQIRRYVHNDVVRVIDVSKLLNLGRIQQYTSNGAKVVHLNPKGSSKPNRDGVPRSYVGGTLCLVCSRAIAKPNGYCSIACKVFNDYDNGGLYKEEDGSVENQTKTPLGNQDIDSSGSSSSIHDSLPSQMRALNFQQNGSFRKKSRKGIPERALFQ